MPNTNSKRGLKEALKEGLAVARLRSAQPKPEIPRFKGSIAKCLPMTRLYGRSPFDVDKGPPLLQPRRRSPLLLPRRRSTLPQPRRRSPLPQLRSKKKKEKTLRQAAEHVIRGEHGSLR